MFKTFLTIILLAAALPAQTGLIRGKCATGRRDAVTWAPQLVISFRRLSLVLSEFVAPASRRSQFQSAARLTWCAPCWPTIVQPQVRPPVFMDAELPFITDEDAPGVTTYQPADG